MDNEQEKVRELLKRERLSEKHNIKWLSAALRAAEHAENTENKK